jgi:hypothetical protein
MKETFNFRFVPYDDIVAKYIMTDSCVCVVQSVHFVYSCEERERERETSVKKTFWVVTPCRHVGRDHGLILGYGDSMFLHDRDIYLLVYTVSQSGRRILSPSPP